MSADQRSTAGDWTRREFVRGAAGVLALTHLPRAMAARLESHFVYVAAGEDDGSGSIYVLRIQDGTSSQVQRIVSRAPSHLLVSAAQQVLYVANDIEKHDRQPRGTVEAFRVHPVAGTLTLLSRTPLSLSATRPRHMALSPDGKWLAVAAYAGGIYNLLPVAEDGSLGPARGIFKDTGSGPHPQWQTSAHPHTIVFDEAGRHLLSSDFGSERLNVFAVDAGRLRRVSQRATRAGSGPSQLRVASRRVSVRGTRPCGFDNGLSLRRSVGCRDRIDSRFGPPAVCCPFTRAAPRWPHALCSR